MYDVIIVGGGVAGAYLASRLSGLNVLLIEKNKNVTQKDSGIVSGDFFDFFDEKFVKHTINRMDAFSPSGHSFTIHDREPFAYILKRELFGKYLRANAKRHSRIVHETVIGIEYFRDFVSVKTTEGQYEARLLVGADGANSVVRHAAGIDDPLLSLGIMVNTKTKMDGNIELFFDKMISPDFFTWIIPQNNEYGIITSSRAAERLKIFEKRQYLTRGSVAAHMVPTGYVRSYAHRTILVGDAAGQNKPLTGGGIMFGLKAAGYAAIAINYAFEDRKLDGSHLSYYEKLWKNDFAWEIDKQFLVRMLYRRLTNVQLDKMFIDLGPEIEKLSNFDYDKVSRAWIKLPKIKLLRALVTMIT